jgi:hypothetical protein
LVLDAFSQWGRPVLSLPAGEEPDSAARETSGELLRLLRTSGASLSWAKGPHTRHLADVLAIFAVAVPHTLKSWMRQEGISSGESAASGSVLSRARFSDVVRLLSKSAAASFWKKQFAEWITEEPDLADIGAQGLAELCGLGDACVGPLAMRIVQHPTESSLQALRELVDRCGSSPRFIEDALALLRHFADAPQSYAILEKEVISTMVRAGGTPSGAVERRSVTLESMERAARGADLPGALRQTLEQARQAIQGAIEEDLLRGEAR